MLNGDRTPQEIGPAGLEPSEGGSFTKNLIKRGEFGTVKKQILVSIYFFTKLRY